MSLFKIKVKFTDSDGFDSYGENTIFMFTIRFPQNFQSNSNFKI